MAYSVIVPVKIQATDIGAYNRVAVCAADIEQGAAVVLTGKSATAGESECWTAVAASTSDGLTGVWLAYSPEVVLTVSGDSVYKGINPDPRNFINKATKTMDVKKPKIGDLWLMSADAFTGAKSTNTYANCTNGTDGQLVWGASATSSVFAMKYLATEYFSISDGSIGTQRITAYLMEVVQE
jgi:hypothetical protein